MKIIKLFFICLLMLYTLSACESARFGMPKSQFARLTSEPKQPVIQVHNERKLRKTKNAPLYAAMDALGNTAKLNKTVPRSNSTQQACHWEGNKRVCNDRSSTSSVNFGFK